MKATLIKVYGAFLFPLIAFFAPIYFMVFLVGLSTLVDTGFGVWKAKSLGEEVSSKLCRKGLIPKLRSYVSIVLLLFTVDYFIVNEFTRLFLDIQFISTKLVSLSLIVIEVRSMDESFKKVKGYSFIGKIYDNLRNIKKIKQEIES
jgi:hypothetical protein